MKSEMPKPPMADRPSDKKSDSSEVIALRKQVAEMEEVIHSDKKSKEVLALEKQVAELKEKLDEDEAPISAVEEPDINGPYEVVATTKGFSPKNERISEGKSFTIDKLSQLGKWMKCKDPIIQKYHEAKMKEKKKLAR